MVAVAVGTDVQPASARSIEETHLFSFENPRNQETVTCEILISNVFPYASDPERAFARTVVTGGPPECFELFDGLNETSVSITGRYRDTSGVERRVNTSGQVSVATEYVPVASDFVTTHRVFFFVCNCGPEYVLGPNQGRK